MKENTYIIPGIDFYIGTSIHCNNEDNILRDIQNMKIPLIPFNKVDGLLIEDLYIPNDAKSLIILAINRIESNRGITIQNVLDLLIFKKEGLASIKNKAIDKVVEKEYEMRYEKASLRKRRIYNSFFEKYQDESHQMTKERIEKLTENNRK